MRALPWTAAAATPSDDDSDDDDDDDGDDERAQIRANYQVSRVSILASLTVLTLLTSVYLL